MIISHRHHAHCGSAAVSTRFALNESERQYERARPFSIAHLALDATLDLKKKAIAAVARLHFERVSPTERDLVLDAIGFEVSAVRLVGERGAKPASYEYDGRQLQIRIPPRVNSGVIEIEYRALPRRGLYFLEPDEFVVDRPLQVWTQCQDEDARHWLPCHDKPHVKMTFELIVQVPSGMVALSNGELVTKKTSGKRSNWTYHFRMQQPLPSYLITLVVGHFEVLEDRPAELPDGRKVPCTYYVPPGKAEDGWRSFAGTPGMIELFSKLTGVSYPWSRYSQIVVSDFIFGGMENTTATTMYEHILLDERAAIDITSNDLIAHELAHQWFGDFVTCRDWSHAWLNEGFATYLEHIDREHRLGRDEYDYGVRADLHAYLAEANGRYMRPVVCRDYAEPIELFDRHLYEKGGQVLHMLRVELGDDLFWKGIRSYLQKHAGGIVETSDLQRAFEQVSGQSFERFFDQWLFQPGHPVLKVKISYEQELLVVSVKQTQKASEHPIYSFLLEVEVAGKNGKIARHGKWVHSAHDSLVLPMPERPAWVAFDPLQRVAASVTVDAPGDLLREQLKSGSSARIRWCAAEALARRDDTLTINALAQTLGNVKEAWMVRVEAAAALGRIRGPESFAALAAQVRTKHPKVRRAIALALGEFKTSASAQLLARLAAEDESYLVTADAARSLGRTRQKELLEPLLRQLKSKSWADVTRAGALDGLSELRDEAAVPAVIEQTHYGNPTRARRAAIMALAKLSDERKTRQHLETLLDDRDPYLRIDAVRALEVLGDVRARGALRRQLDRETDGRVARRIRESLRDMSDGFAADRKRFSTEIESLNAELAELRTRLAKLESARKKAHPDRGAAGSSEPQPEPKPEPQQGAETSAPLRKKRPAKAAPRQGSKPSRARSIRNKLDERGNT